MLLYAPLPDLRGEHWTKSVPPEPHRFVADIDTALEQNILDLSQRKRIANIHHHHEADHLGRTVEITEGIAHCRRLRNLARRLNPIYSDNALTSAFARKADVAPLSAERTPGLLSDQSIAKVEALVAWASERDDSRLELALTWLASHQIMSTVIAGATMPEQIKANIAATATWTLDADELAAVDQVLKAAGSQPRLSARFRPARGAG